jgi:hypothetical protein
MAEQGSDRRESPRYTVIMDARITDVQMRSTVHLRCSDISITGCYLDTLNPLDRGTALTLRLEHAGQVFETAAKVTYTVPRLGMGLTFEKPTPPDQLAVLEGWIREAAATGYLLHPAGGRNITR